MNKKLLLCLAASLLLTFALAFALVGCSEELPSDESAVGVSKEESANTSSDTPTSSEGESSQTQETSSETEASSEAEDPSETEDSSAQAEFSEPEVSSQAPSDESSDEPEPSEEPSQRDESSDEPEPSEPEESSDEPEPSEEPSQPDESSDEPEPSEEPSEPDESSEPAESSDTEVSEPDGSGNEEDPYLYIPREGEPVTTLKIQPGTSVFYAIYRVGGMDLTISSDDVYVIHEGVTYTPVNGVLTLRVENALASAPVMFLIGNNGSEACSFALHFANPLGTMGNPEVREEFSASTVVSLEAGNEIGYFYRHVATQNGTIRFYFTATADSVIVVTNNRSYAQRSSDGVDTVDDQGRTYFEIEVQEGDELSINMGAIPNRRGKYPATVITWSAEYLS